MGKGSWWPVEAFLVLEKAVVWRHAGCFVDRNLGLFLQLAVAFHGWDPFVGPEIQ